MIGCLFFEKYNTIYLFLPENNTNATMSATAIHDFSLQTTDFGNLYHNSVNNRYIDCYVYCIVLIMY